MNYNVKGGHVWTALYAINKLYLLPSMEEFSFMTPIHVVSEGASLS